MKTKPLFFALILITLATSCFGQSIDTASEWRVDYARFETGQPALYGKYRDYIDGDTVINSHVYFKVYSTGYWYYYPNPNPANNYFYHSLHGYLREEGSKWYTSDGYSDLLLYDYTLDVGDTVVSAFLYTWAGPVIITAIDSILVDTNYRKRFHLSSPLMGAEYIIDGIGSTAGLFENMVFDLTQSELICFAKNGVSLWGSSAEECQLNVALNEKEKKKPGFIVFPNPANDHFIVKTNFSESRVQGTIRLYDLTGKELHSYEISDKNGQMVIPITNLKPGLYFLELYINEKREGSVKIAVIR